jgi:hypothetical protein
MYRLNGKIDYMSAPEESTLRNCIVCGARLSTNPIALRIISNSENVKRPSYCADCAVDQGKAAKGDSRA